MNIKSEMILRPERMKYVRSFVSSVIFTVLGVKIGLQTGSMAGWIIASVFAFAAVASFIPVLPNQSYLKLDLHGFTIRSMFRTVKIKWNDVESFEARKRNLKGIVAYSYKNRMDKNFLNVENLIGKTEVLPDVYGMDAQGLAELMERYRIRSVFQSSPPETN